MERGSREYVLWSIGILVVLLFALIPVLWIISVSLKTPDTLADGSFIPKDITFDNYKGLFEGGIDASPFIKPLINSLVIASITTVVAIVLAAFAAYAIARLNFPGKSLILAGALAIAMFPAISTVGPLFDMWRALGLYDTYLGLIIPYLTFSLPLAIYTLVAFFREIPWDLEQAAQVDGATPFQAFPQGDRPARGAGCLHRGDPRLHLRVERLPVRDHADLVGRRAHRPGRARLLHRRVHLHRADGQHRRRRGDRDGADHHLRPVLPAPHRRRPDRGSGQGMTNKGATS